MRRLLLLLYKYRAFLVFVLLEIVCSWLIIQNNRYQNVAFFNSSNRLVAGLLSTSSGITDYFSLKNVNDGLAAENALLRKKIEQYNQLLNQQTLAQMDSSEKLQQFDFQTAKVVKNSINVANNYITINKGKKDGVKSGMGVITGKGIVGKVKYASSHFAVITSLLHRNAFISSKIKRTGNICTTFWTGDNPYIANLNYVTRHISLQEGDTIVTSGYNAIFPEDVMIGTIKSFEIEENAAYYNVEVDISTDFSQLSYVYILNNKLKHEKDSLQDNVIIDD